MDRALNHPPGPKGIPILGNALQLHRDDPLGYWLKAHGEFGDVVKVKLGPLDAYSFASPAAIHDILVTKHKQMRKGMAYSGLRMLLGEGLITTDKPHWASQRKRLNPIFAPGSVNAYAPAILAACAASLPELDALAKRGAPLDISKLMARLTMRVVSKTTFGVDLGEEQSEVADAIEFAFSFVADITIQPMRAPMFVPTRRNQKYKKALALINGFADILIQKSRASTGATDMHTRVFSSLSGIDQTLLRDEVISLYFAGFETTARTLTFMIHLLARHPEILEKLRLETDSINNLEDLGSPVGDLPVASEIVNETLRLYPPVSMMARQAKEDCEIEGVPLRKNSLVIVNPFLAQRDKTYWPAGETFSPDFKNPLSKRLQHRGAFAPFGAGPRICLGKHFANIELALAISVLAREFDWKLEDDGPLNLAFHGTLQPKNPVLARFTARR